MTCLPKPSELDACALRSGQHPMREASSHASFVHWAMSHRHSDTKGLVIPWHSPDDGCMCAIRPLNASDKAIANEPNFHSHVLPLNAPPNQHSLCVTQHAIFINHPWVSHRRFQSGRKGYNILLATRRGYAAQATAACASYRIVIQYSVSHSAGPASTCSTHALGCFSALEVGY